MLVNDVLTPVRIVIFSPKCFRRNVHESYRIGWNPSLTVSDSCRFRTSQQLFERTILSSMGSWWLIRPCVAWEKRATMGSNVVLTRFVVVRRGDRNVELERARGRRGEAGLCNAEEY